MEEVSVNHYDSIFFFMGRANPPTLGHINAMLDILKIARKNSANPLILIFLSTNTNNLKYTASIRKRKRNKPIESLVKQIAAVTATTERGQRGTLSVKNKMHENPLAFAEKKIYVEEMLNNYITHINNVSPEEERDVSLSSYLKYHLEILPAEGLYDCFRQVMNRANTHKIGRESLYYVYGIDERKAGKKTCDTICAINNMEDRHIICKNSRVILELETKQADEGDLALREGFNCLPIPRDEGTGAGISGSGLRLLAAGLEGVRNQKKFVEHYVNSGLLSNKRATQLFNSVQDKILNLHTTAGEEISPIGPPQKLPSVKKQATVTVKGGRKTRRKKRKGKKKTYKRKHKKNKTKRKIKRKRKKNLKKRTKKR